MFRDLCARISSDCVSVVLTVLPECPACGSWLPPGPLESGIFDDGSLRRLPFRCASCPPVFCGGLRSRKEITSFGNVASAENLVPPKFLPSKTFDFPRFGFSRILAKRPRFTERTSGPRLYKPPRQQRDGPAEEARVGHAGFRRPAVAHRTGRATNQAALRSARFTRKRNWPWSISPLGKLLSPTPDRRPNPLARN